jgi:hypothetical protein
MGAIAFPGLFSRWIRPRNIKTVKKANSYNFKVLAKDLQWGRERKATTFWISSGVSTQMGS